MDGGDGSGGDTNRGAAPTWGREWASADDDIVVVVVSAAWKDVRGDPCANCRRAILVGAPCTPNDLCDEPRACCNPDKVEADGRMLNFTCVASKGCWRETDFP